MEPRIRFSRWSLVLATGFFLVALFDSPPSDPAIPVDRPDAPTDAQLEALTELSEWVLGGSAAPMFESMKDRSFPSTGEPSGEENEVAFELFRRYHGREAGVSAVERRPFGRLIVAMAERYSVDPLLVAAVMEVESGFDPNAVSAMGAIGLMQVLPTTVELYSDEDPFEPAVNVRVGVRYLRALLDQFDGDVTLALAAYNAGPGNVLKHEGVPPFRETRNYVERVLSLYVDQHQAIWQQSEDRRWFL